MSEPIRSASAAPFAAARPQVHSRRVSLRVGAFGLTYTTDRLLWEAPAAPTAADPAPVDPAPAIEAERPQPRPETSTFPADLETARRLSLWASAQDQAARQQGLAGQANGQTNGQANGQAGGQKTSREGAAAQGLGQGGGQVGGLAAGGLASGSGPLAESQARPSQAQSGAAQSGTAQNDAVLAGQGQAEQLAAALSDSGKAGNGRATGTQAGRSRGSALAQAMRHATRAYQACQAGFACPRPMLQAVA